MVLVPGGSRGTLGQNQGHGPGAARADQRKVGPQHDTRVQQIGQGPRFSGSPPVSSALLQAPFSIMAWRAPHHTSWYLAQNLSAPC